MIVAASQSRGYRPDAYLFISISQFDFLATLIPCFNVLSGGFNLLGAV